MGQPKHAIEKQKYYYIKIIAGIAPQVIDQIITI